MTAINLSDLPLKQDAITATGLLKGTGSAVVPAVAATDYLTPTGDASGLTGLTAGQVTTALGYQPASATGVAPQLVSADTFAVNGGIYVITAACKLSLPSNPSSGWRVYFTTKFTGTATIGRNGSLIESLAEDMTTSQQNLPSCLMYVDATFGWINQ